MVHTNRKLHAPAAFLPQGWAANVLLEVDGRGDLIRVEPGVTDPAAETLAGPVLPGVPNLHSHTFQRALAGLAEHTVHGTRQGAPDTFWSWRETMYRFLELLAPEDVEAIAGLAFSEMLRAGYTAVAEFHYLHLDPEGRPYPNEGEISRRIIQAALHTGIGVTHLPALYRAGGFGGTPPAPGQKRFLLSPDGWLELVESLRDEHGGAPQVQIGAAIHSLRAVPPEELEGALTPALERAPGAPIHIHVAEQTEEVEGCMSRYGRRPVELLLDHAPVDEHWCLVHATHTTREELGRVADREAVVGLCPTTEANLGDGLFPLRDHLQLGGRFGIGSDSHVSVSPVEELRWLEYGQRLALGERNVAAGSPGESTGEALFRAALEGGRRACGRPIGRIAPGNRADLIVLDPAHPDLAVRPAERTLDTWLFSGNADAVRDVLVGGAMVVSEGRHRDQEALTEGYRKRVARLVSSL